jgi:hypothetical protein
VAALLATAERIGFFDLSDQYRTIRNPDGTETIVTDLPTAFVTITRGGQSKRVEDYIGAPQALKQLEQLIDDTARTKRWIRLDAQTLQQLVRSGWSPSVEERAELLRKALQHDEVDVVKTLLEIGADPNAAYYGTNTPPLMMVRSSAAARALIEAGAIPFVRNDNGGTPLGWAVHLGPDVTEVLLKAGVQVDQSTDSDGRTALSQAACGGNAGVVKLLLIAGANPALRPGGTSAVDCARQGRENTRLGRPSVLDSKPPFFEDFDGVIALLEQALARQRTTDRAEAESDRDVTIATPFARVNHTALRRGSGAVCAGRESGHPGLAWWRRHALETASGDTSSARRIARTQ